jgi:hypothetical protein
MPRDRDLAAEHQAEALRVRERENDIGLAHGAQPAGRSCGALRLAQHRETVRRQPCEQRLAPREMPVRRAVRHPRPACDLAQAECRNPFFFQDLSGRPQQRGLEVAVMIAALAGLIC